MLQLPYFLILAAALFCVGIYGLVNSRNAVRVLMSIELMLNAVNLNLMGFSNYIDPVEIKGQVWFAPGPGPIPQVSYFTDAPGRKTITVFPLPVSKGSLCRRACNP